MASSMPTFRSLFQSLRAAAARAVADVSSRTGAPCPPVTSTPILVPSAVRPVRAQAQRPPVQRVARGPVRVLRVAEAGSRRAAGARLVISGRLADVCAELDRLAALEAAAS